MATTVTDLLMRLRQAGMPEEQATAVASAFETLDRRLDRIEHRLDRIELWLRIQAAMIALLLAAVLAPYVGASFGLR